MIQCEWESGIKYDKLMCTGKSYFDSIKRRRYVETICECHTIKWIRFDSIKRGFSTSCGCIVKTRLSKDKPASIHGLSAHHLYSVYKHMISRCYDETDLNFVSYGKIGVIVCDEWKNNVSAFYNWAILKWKRGLELDKDKLYSQKFGTKTGFIYSPEYCCFISKKENREYTSRSRYLEYNGVKMTLSDWALKLGISDKTLGERLNRYGWSIEETLSIPKLSKGTKIKNGYRLSP